MGKILDLRRAATGVRMEALRQRLAATEQICGDSACVYATGSIARGDASAHSDLDLFIVGCGCAKQPVLSHLNEILIQADLIRATRELGFPDFSGDGAYLKHYTIGELVEELGAQEDDAKNTFTARCLLLLESQPLLAPKVYDRVIKSVIDAYWRDYPGHESNFMPAFLTNDILRMWRTFCVNYENRRQSEPAEKKAKAKLKRFKLAHSRLLTCYSALLYLLASFARQGAVPPEDAARMVALTPTKRLEWLLSLPEQQAAHSRIRDLIGLYEGFLSITDKPEAQLVEEFLDARRSAERANSAYAFGDLVFGVLDTIGRSSPNQRFYRLLVV